MTYEQKALLVILSRILDYKDDQFIKEQSWILSFIRHSILTKEIQEKVLMPPIPAASICELEDKGQSFDSRCRIDYYIQLCTCWICLNVSTKRGNLCCKAC